YLFIFLLILLLSISTLFPYTTLFRSNLGKHKLMKLTTLYPSPVKRFYTNVKLSAYGGLLCQFFAFFGMGIVFDTFLFRKIFRKISDNYDSRKRYYFYSHREYLSNN